MIVFIVIAFIVPPPLSFPLIHAAPAGAPQSVTADALSPTIFILRWRPPLAGDGNGIVRNYTINITELESGRMEQFITEELNITVESRHPFYRYRYIIAAETVSLGPFTDPNVIHMPEAGWLICVCLSVCVSSVCICLCVCLSVG